MIRVSTVIQCITYACALLSFAAVVEYVENYHLIGFLCLSGFALWCERHRVVQIPRWLRNTISLGVLYLAIFRITLTYLIEPFLDALLILTAVKLLEDKKVRDYMQIYLLCLLLLVGSTLISLSINFLLTLSLFLMLGTAALVLLAYFAHDPEMAISNAQLRKILVQALGIFSLSLPLSVVLFVILPRTAFPFLTFLNKAGYARSGFADTISLGQVSAIQEDGAVIFRAGMERVDDNNLFWRGVVLDTFDGTRWTGTLQTEKEQLADPQTVHGRLAEQTIYLEPYGNRYLFALDKPLVLAIHRNQYSRKHVTPFKTKIFERIRYTVTSCLSDRLQSKPIDRGHYLALPEGFAPEVKRLVQRLVGQEPQEDRVKTLFAFLRQGAYGYSLEDLPVSESPLEAFLLVERRGNCEYFASSLAVMLRMAGIPARLIGGYKGGQYNDAGKYYLVSQRNAHVWVEAHLPHLGWLRLDPTPPPALPPSTTSAGRMLLQLRLILDTFNYYWYKVIIDYDFTQQVEIVNTVRERITQPDLGAGLDLTTLKNHFLPPALAIAAILLLWGVRNSHQKRENRIIARFLRRMAARGYVKQPHEGLEEFVRRIEGEDLKARARSFVEDFEQVYYRDREYTRETHRRLKLRLKGL